MGYNLYSLVFGGNGEKHHSELEGTITKIEEFVSDYAYRIGNVVGNEIRAFMAVLTGARRKIKKFKK